MALSTINMRAAATGESDLAPTTVKTRQSHKIRELGDALVAEGFLTLDQQAQALGLCRSTTWTILKADHKASGLSASVINRMLAAARLPPLVRAKMLEYIDEKIAGSYGHSKTQIRRFTARLGAKRSRQSLGRAESTTVIVFGSSGALA
jgi:predicted DNA-binding transcriptional regulator AlpA